MPILKPRFPWEFVQIGNCGSPIEIDEGWLMLTHGVAPCGEYSIGAVLLIKRTPRRFSPGLASRWSSRRRQSVRDMSRMSSTHAA